MRRNYSNEVLANFIKDNDIKTADIAKLNEYIN